MITECRHVLASGKKCQAVSVTNSSFCFFHRNQRLRQDTPVRPGTPFILPTLEDAHSALNAVNDVFHAMGEGRLKRAEAGTYLYGIQIAARLIMRIDQTSIKPVRNLCYDNYGTELGEETSICEPPEDCLKCTRRDSCEDFEDYEEEVAELEQQLAEQEQDDEHKAERQDEKSEADKKNDVKQVENEFVVKNLQAAPVNERRSILESLQAMAATEPQSRIIKQASEHALSRSAKAGCPMTPPTCCHSERTGDPQALSSTGSPKSVVALWGRAWGW